MAECRRLWHPQQEIDMEVQETHSSSSKTAGGRYINWRYRAAFLRGVSYALTSNGKYKRAMKKLDELRQISHPMDLDCMLLRAECALYLGRDVVALTEFQSKILKSKLTPDDLAVWSDELQEQRRFSCVVILHRASCDKIFAETPRRESYLYTITRIVYNIYRSMSSLMEQDDRGKSIIKDYFIGFLKPIIFRVCSANDVDSSQKIVLEAKCLNYAICASNAVNDYKQSIQLAKDFLRISHAKPEAHYLHRSRVYCDMCCNLGVAYRDLKDFKSAERMFQRGHKSYDRVSDCSDEDRHKMRKKIEEVIRSIRCENFSETKHIDFFS